jgi:large subunit ribosomal protein L10
MAGKGSSKKSKIAKRKPDNEVPLYKKTQLKDVVAMAKNNKVIGIACWTSIPSAQMQQMRQAMGHDIQLKIVRNNILYLGLRDALGSVPAVEDLLKNVNGQSAVVATNMNPFKLFKKLENTKTKAPARGGEIAPEDVVVNEGETEFKPGPIVGELSKVGIPAGIEGGKVVIKTTKTMVKAGQVIPKALAPMLGRLGVLPLTVGLDLKAVLELGVVYKRDVLNVDDALIMSQVTGSAQGAFNLAMFVAYPTKLTMKPLLAKAYNQAMGVTIKAAIVNKASVGPLFAKAKAQAAYIQSIIDEKANAGKPKDAISGEVLKKDDKKKPDKKVEAEGDMAAGLGSLFG